MDSSKFRSLIAPLVPEQAQQLRRRMLSRRFYTRTLERCQGHDRSVAERRAVDADGQPLPWYTYPAIEYLDQLDFSGARVFEWGSGWSTLWWAERALQVHSVEHDPKWFAALDEQRRRGNIALELQPKRAGYAGAILADEGRWNVIVVDGQARMPCAGNAVQRLAPGGLLIVDNSDWFPEVCAFLREQGLLQVDLHGFGPIAWATWCTSLFFTRDFARVPRHGRQPVFSRGGGPRQAELVDELLDD